MLIACTTCHRQYDAGPHEPGARLRCHCGTMMEVPHARPRDVRMLHCSSCGAGLAAGSTSCGYCGASVGLGEKGLGDNCPSCFSRMVAGAKFCSSCGTGIEPEAVQHALASHDCPRCARSMTATTAGDLAYEQCTTCGGLWLDEALMKRLIDARGKERPVLPPSLAHRAEATPPGSATSPQSNQRPNQSTYIACPVCEQMMNRRNFAGRSGVILDWCKGHGYWFDADELERVMAFVDAGGLERARQRDLDDAERRGRAIAAREFARNMHAGAARPTTATFGGRRRSRTTLFDAVADFLGGLLD